MASLGFFLPAFYEKASEEVIKNIIDIIEIQHKTLYSKDTNTRKERDEKAKKNYGCKMTNFFLFKLENDIFSISG
jgi:hypothetical protein